MRRLHRAWAVCLGCTLMLLVSGSSGIAVGMVADLTGRYAPAIFLKL